MVNVGHSMSTIWNINPNQDGNVRINVTLCCVRANIGFVEKEFVVHNLSLCLKTSVANQYNASSVQYYNLCRVWLYKFLHIIS